MKRKAESDKSSRKKPNTDPTQSTLVFASESQEKRPSRSKTIKPPIVIEDIDSEAEFFEKSPKTDPEPIIAKKSTEKKPKKKKSKISEDDFEEEDFEAAKPKKSKKSKSKTDDDFESDEDSESSTQKSKNKKKVVKSKTKKSDKKSSDQDVDNEESDEPTTKKSKSKKSKKSEKTEKEDSGSENEKAVKTGNPWKYRVPKHLFDKEPELTVPIPPWKPTIVKTEDLKVTGSKSLKARHGEREYEVGAYESIEIKDGTFLINLEMPIWALDWAKSDQHFLAICPYVMDVIHFVNGLYDGPGHVYIYNCKKKPTLHSMLVFENNGFINDVKFMPRDCTTTDRLGILAICFANGTFGVYSVPLAAGKHTISGYEFKSDMGPATVCAWGPKLDRIACGFGDGTITVFVLDDVKICTPAFQYTDSNTCITGLAFSDMNQNMLLAGAIDQFHYLYDTGDACRVVYRGHAPISSTSAVCSLPGKFGFLQSTSDGYIKFLHIGSGVLTNAFLTEGLLPPIMDLKSCVTGGYFAASCSDGSVYILLSEIHRGKRRASQWDGKTIRVCYVEKVEDDTISIDFEHENFEMRVVNNQTSLNKIAIYPSYTEDRNLLAFGGNLGMCLVSKIEKAK